VLIFQTIPTIAITSWNRYSIYISYIQYGFYPLSPSPYVLLYECHVLERNIQPILSNNSFIQTFDPTSVPFRKQQSNDANRDVHW